MKLLFFVVVLFVSPLFSFAEKTHPSLSVPIVTEPSDTTAVYEKNAYPVGGIAEIAKHIVYPQKAKDAGIEGMVILVVLIDESGNPVTFEVKQAPGFGMAEAAIAAVKSVRFTPAERNGSSVKQSLTIPLRFALDSEAQEKKKEANPKSEVYTEVDQMPFPLNGIAELAKNIDYPLEAKEKKITGKVIVGAVIDTDGNATQVKVIKNVHPLLDEAAINAVKRTKFTPGVLKGKKVRVSIALPINFKLE